MSQVLGWIFASVFMLVTVLVALLARSPEFWIWIANRRQGKTSEPAAESDSTYQKYGHPHAPVPYLHKKLPNPPSGYAWEIKVEPNEANRPALMISLIEISTEESVATKCVDLIKVDENQFWADMYRSDDGRFYFENRFVSPFLSWARRQVNEFTTYESSGEYLMKTRDQ